MNDIAQAQNAQYARYQQLLAAITRWVAAHPAAQEALPPILAAAQEASGAAGVRLLLRADGGGWDASSHGTGAGAMAAHDDAVAAQVRDRGRVERNRRGDEADAALPDGFAGLVALPVEAEGALLGVLWLAFEHSHTSTLAEWGLLETLAAQAAIVAAHARAAAEATRRGQWLETILDSAPDPVIVIDQQRVVQLLNPPAEALLGLASGEGVGAPLDAIVGDPALRALFAPQPPPSDGAPVEYRTASGQAYTPRIAEVRAANGEAAGWVLTLRDITHFKRINRNMSEFLGTVSHDMRSPLTFMKGYLDMLGMIGPLNEKQEEFVDKIGAGTIQMAEMVEKILDAGKLDPMTGDYQLLREPSDVAELARRAVQAMAEPARKKSLALHAAIADDVPILNVDAAMLASALNNLVENAVKYTPESGRIDVSLRVEGDFVVFRVRDDGYGISPEDQARLFQRNVRVRRKEWKRVKGSGLGLFIVKNVAQRHGGDAWVESEEGAGSEFGLSIPVTGTNRVGAG